ncbi:MAG: hypothetical protein ACK56I_29425, partial [bacterium]
IIMTSLLHDLSSVTWSSTRRVLKPGSFLQNSTMSSTTRMVVSQIWRMRQFPVIPSLATACSIRCSSSVEGSS